MRDRSPSRARRARAWLAVAGWVAATGALALISALGGPPTVGLDALAQALSADDLGALSDSAFALRALRLPRLLLAIAAGAALGASGVVLQDALRNPLADPGLLGVSQGATFAAALAAVYPELTPPLPLPILCALSGAVVGAALLAGLGRLRDPAALILAGAACASLLGTLTTIVLAVAPFDRVAFGVGSFLRYLSGSVSQATWDDLAMLAPWLAVALPLAWLSAPILNLLRLGDDLAAGVGLAPQAARVGVLAVALALVGPVVAFAGPMTFVALLAPHIARACLGRSNARWTLPAAALVGAAVVLSADLSSRVVFAPAEVPAGVWTIGVAGPLALITLRWAPPAEESPQ